MGVNSYEVKHDMPRNNDTLDAILELNVMYLQFARKRLKENLQTATSLLSMSAEVAEVVASLTDAQLLRLARSNMILCRLKWDDHTILSGLAEKVSKELLSAGRVECEAALA
ncbi:flagellar transcriptional regulator FlhD [Burkholderia ubonensis]|nr:flagellar transcriptional regulator FlhD [Burkholderia ubonensis]